jgi:hypothetical protein
MPERPQASISHACAGCVSSSRDGVPGRRAAPGRRAPARSLRVPNSADPEGGSRLVERRRRALARTATSPLARVDGGLELAFPRSAHAGAALARWSSAGGCAPYGGIEAPGDTSVGSADGWHVCRLSCWDEGIDSAASSTGLKGLAGEASGGKRLKAGFVPVFGRPSPTAALPCPPRLLPLENPAGEPDEPSALWPIGSISRLLVAAGCGTVVEAPVRVRTKRASDPHPSVSLSERPHSKPRPTISLASRFLLSWNTS